MMQLLYGKWCVEFFKKVVLKGALLKDASTEKNLSATPLKIGEGFMGKMVILWSEETKVQLFWILCHF